MDRGGALSWRQVPSPRRAPSSPRRLSPPSSPRSMFPSNLSMPSSPLHSPVPSPRKFRLRSSNNSALQLERANWNKWIRSIKDGTVRPLQAYEIVTSARLTFPSSVISRRDCGEMVVLLIRMINSWNSSEVDIDIEVENDKQAQTTGDKTIALQKETEKESTLDSTEEPEEERRGVSDLVTYFFQKKHIDLGPNELGAIVPFLLSEISLAQGNHTVCLSGLQALSFVLFNYASRCGMYQDAILATLVQLLSGQISALDETGLSCISMAYSCVGNLLQRKAIEKNHEPQLVACTTNTLFTYHRYIVESSGQAHEVELRLPRSKVICSVLRVMHGMTLAFGAGPFSEGLSVLVTSLVQLICHGLTSAIDEKKFRQRMDQQVHCSGGAVSESELSDSDVERKSSSSRYLKQMEKVKVMSLELLQSLCRVEHKGMANLWDRLLPVKNGCDEDTKTPTMLTVLLFDPQPKVRSACYGMLTSLMEHSPVRLWLSQRRPKTSQAAAFSSLSMKVARMAEQIHIGLGKALTSEKNPTAIAHLLVCLSVLFKVVPYEAQDNQEMLAELLQENTQGHHPLLDILFAPKQHAKVLEAAVPCLASLLSGPKTSLAVVQEMVSTSFLPLLLKHQKNKDEHQSTTDYILGLPNTLLLCAKTATWYSQSLLEEGRWQSDLYPSILAGFASRDTSSREAAVLLVHQLAKVDSFPSNLLPPAEWTEVIALHIPRALRDVEPTVRASAAGCLADVRLGVWGDVPLQRRRECLQNIIDAAVTSTSSPQVRLACLSALASMALLFSFKVDTAFLESAVPTMLAALQDEAVPVRSRAAIAVANTVSTHESELDVLPGTLQSRLDELYASQAGIRPQLFQALLAHVDDTDKVAAPVMRALGFLLATPADDQALFEPAKARVIECLSGSSSSKVALNACNAVIHVLQSSKTFDIVKDTTLRTALVQSARTSENFKIRASAVSAIAASVPWIDTALNEEWIGVFANEYVELWQAKHALSSTQAKHVEKLGSCLIQLVHDLFQRLSSDERCSLVDQHHTLMRALYSAVDIHHPDMLAKLPQLE